MAETLTTADAPVTDPPERRGRLGRLLTRGEPRPVPMIGRRNITLAWLVFVVAVFLVLRLPSSVILAGLLPAVVIARNGLRFPRREAVPLLVFMLVALLTASFTWLTVGGAPLVNNATVMAVMIALVLAITCSTVTQQALRFLMNGIQAALWICLIIAIFEVVTGMKVLPMIYPDANTAGAIANNRFIVAAFFPNFNDFSVAMALFGMILVAQLLIGTKVPPLLKIARIAAYLAAWFFIIVIGSRGALLALFLGTLLVALTAARLTRRRLLSVPNMLVLVLSGIAVALFLMSTPFVQDNSTMKRNEIVNNILVLLGEQSAHLWGGWSTMVLYQTAAEERFGPMLMDPHNLLFEIVVMYGLPALVCYALVWAQLAYRGLWQLRIAAGWREVSAVAISVMLPVIGIVPSQTLRYYWLFLFGAAAVAALQVQGGRRDQVLGSAPRRP